MKSRNFPFLILFITLTFTFAHPPLAQGHANEPSHCGMGEVQTAMEAIEVGAMHWNPFLGESGEAGLGAFFDCQYRLFLKKNPVTGHNWMFCEEDMFLGGAATVYSYEAFPVCDQSFTPCSEDGECPIDGGNCANDAASAKAFLERLSETASFGPRGGTLEAQEILRTAVKYIHDPVDGGIAWYQSAFITQEDPGIYRSRLKFYGDGEFQEQVTVDKIEVVTHKEHLKRVANGTWK